MADTVTASGWLLRDAPVEAVDVTARTVTVRLCRWSDPRDVVERDGTAYREQHAPGSIDVAGDCHVVDHHHGVLIGRADPASLVDDGDGPVVDLRVARTAAGTDTLELLDAGVIRSVSMEFEPRDATRDRDGVITRTRSVVHGIAFAFRPQYDAPVLALREDPTMPTIDTPTPTVDPPTPPPAPTVAAVDEATLHRALDDFRRELDTRDPMEIGHPASRYRSLDDYATAAWAVLDDDARNLLHRALVDQITTNNPGVIPPGWLSTVVGIVDRGRPVISSFGVLDTPSEGMDISWPHFAGDLLTLVGKQAAEKTPITSVRVDLLRGTQPLETYAGGSDLSYQLIRRSSPSYRDAYMRIMYAAYAAVTESNATAQVLAEATGSVVFVPGTGDADALRAALFEASVAVEAATGAPAGFALVATDVFIALGGLPGLWPGPYGTNNTAGTADAGSLRVNVSGLEVRHAPYMADGQGIVSNSLAGGWFEDGPFAVAAEDVEKLGQNVAVWGMGAFGTMIPGGVVKFVPVAGTTRRGKSE